ncbi:MAG: outer membrane beta-barrel protein [Proteobacteria bacterium]|nr:outer membrane beta-barrel protein [Pseudomonadota bacterium]
MKTSAVISALSGIAALALAGGAQAQAFAPKTAGMVVVDLRVSDVAPVADDAITTLAGAPTGLKAKATDSVMPTLGVTYFFTPNWAVEAIAGTTRHTIKAQGGPTNVEVKDTWVLPPVVALQYHFLPAEKFSPYVGAGVNYMLFYGGKDKNGFQLKVDDGFGAALQAGVDVALQDRWTFNADLKKIFFQTKASDSKNGLKSTVNLDPWVASLGVGYRF